ncbi:MAG: nucleoside kinase [Eubacteriales bacterium]|nr:nucleoside kinase [Eubacteriales bacterium]
MAEYTLKYINHRARYDTADFIHDCEKKYHEQVSKVADEIAENSAQKPIVLLNGPSSSGKTTTNDRLSRALEKRGIHAELISMDDYYRSVGTYEIPNDPENGVPDLESPECMNLPLLSQHLAQLVAGEEIEVPRFDFETRTFIPNTRALRLDPDEVVLIEGIHAFNPVIMGDLAHAATGVYLSVASSVVPKEGPRLEPHMLRFLRRAMRDSLFRNSPVEDTLRQWNSVRRGEKLYIAPYRGQANMTVDTFLPYELNILMTQLAPQLTLHKELLEHDGLAPVGAVLGQVAPIDYADFIPEDSVLHEFVG